MVVAADAGVHGGRRLPGLPRDGVPRRQPDRPDLPLGRQRLDAANGRTSGASRPRSGSRLDGALPQLQPQRRRPDRALLPDPLPPARRQQAPDQRHARAGDPLCRLGAQRPQCRARPRRGGWRLHLERRPRDDGHHSDAPRRGRHLVDRCRGCARTGRLRRVRPHPVHVPDHQGQRLGRLSHRPLLALPDRQRPGQSGEQSGEAWSGRRQDLDGIKSCSVVIDPERVVSPRSARSMRRGSRSGRRRSGRPTRNSGATSSTPSRPLPTRLEDLVIYELHVDGLGVGRNPRGMLDDAMDLLDYLVDLGVNAVELMPLAEYEGWANWGYGTSHYMAIEYAGGGRDQFKHFIKACHQRGIAVLVDVVYNHFTHDGERAEWAYNSDAPETQHLLLVRGALDRLPECQSSRHRRLCRQHVDRLCAALLGGDGPQDVHLQRGGAGDGVSRRRLPRRSDDVDPFLRGAARQWPGGQQRAHLRRQVPARMVAHLAADQARACS